MAQTSEKAFETCLEQMLTDGGWRPGTHAEWDKARSLFPARVFAFIETTQPKLWAEMAAQHRQQLAADAAGCAVQVPCHPGDHSTTDMVLAVNGLPVATIELKNPGTHQTWRHAVKQYQSDRDPRVPLFCPLTSFLDILGHFLFIAKDEQKVDTNSIPRQKIRNQLSPCKPPTN